MNDSYKKLKEEIAFLKKQVEELDRFKIAVEEVRNHVIITDIDGKIIYANKAAQNITGFSKEEMIGSNPRLWGKLMDKAFYENLWKTIKEEKKPFRGEIKNHKKNGEIYYAITSITPLIDRLGKLIGFIGIEEDITKLKKLDQMKDDFLSMASHELRSPLTAIKWFTERLSTKDTDKERLSILKKIDVSTQKMINLVNSLLNISRIESGRLIVNSVLFDLPQLVNKILKEVRMKYPDKEQMIKTIIEPGVLQVENDQDLIGEVMINLLTNAIKYSPYDTKIIVRLFLDGAYIIFEVADHGYGIPENEQKNMFKRFFRAENIVTKVTEGTGLGLYLSNIIAKAISGKLSFESKENQGSVFRFSIPVTSIAEKKGDVSLQKQ